MAVVGVPGLDDGLKQHVICRNAREIRQHQIEIVVASLFSQQTTRRIEDGEHLLP